MNGVAILDYLNRLGKRERALIFFLSVVLFLSIGYRMFWQPYLSQQKKFKNDLQKILNQVQSIKSQFPDTEAAKQENAKLRREYESVLKEISAYEARIPSASSASQLLGGITGRSEGLNMDFESIRQNIEKEKEGYSKLQLNIKFASPYSSIVNYLRRLEKISDYLTVEGIGIAQAKEAGPQTKAELQLSLLLAERGIDLTLKEEEAPLPLAIQRDPFVSREMKRNVEKDFKLSGITWAGKNSTAIINNEVARVGTQIGEWKVTQILPDAVILSNGVETTSLTLSR